MTTYRFTGTEAAIVQAFVTDDDGNLDLLWAQPGWTYSGLSFPGDTGRHTDAGTVFDPIVPPELELVTELPAATG